MCEGDRFTRMISSRYLDMAHVSREWSVCHMCEGDRFTRMISSRYLDDMGA